ncbi:hypothetical protein [methane-oxidizing endosymbiont of Gigantopelta aegis]|uniref:hypothetical protein n=1 Tax=methane-oxidizing endosymbiont of Gigantopelta aegis TaxID=2794938 RepID=UPI0018DD7FA5|nr:hypothetical protein [methane-oxidizing endosymbiont of Gigantopelta aegis]
MRTTQQELRLFQSRFDKRLVLTAEAIVEISQAVSRDFAPRMQRSQQAVSAQMLRDVSRTIRRQYRSITQRVNHAEPVCVVMPVDAGHLHVYWRLPEVVADKVPVIKLSSAGTTEQVEVFFRPEINDCQSKKTIIPLPSSLQNSHHRVSIGCFDARHQFCAVLESTCVASSFAQTLDGQREAQGDTMTTLNHSGQGL